jgi:hypothetical protein
VQRRLCFSSRQADDCRGGFAFVVFVFVGVFIGDGLFAPQRMPRHRHCAFSFWVDVVCLSCATRERAWSYMKLSRAPGIEGSFSSMNDSKKRKTREEKLGRVSSPASSIVSLSLSLIKLTFAVASHRVNSYPALRRLRQGRRGGLGPGGGARARGQRAGHVQGEIVFFSSSFPLSFFRAEALGSNRASLSLLFFFFFCLTSLSLNLSSTSLSPTQTVLGIILGGGAGSRLYPLTKKRAKPAVPLGANYRLIDIPVSNCINSGVNKVYTLTQFNSASLNRHLAQAYNVNVGGYRSRGFVEVLAASQSVESKVRGELFFSFFFPREVEEE